MGGWGAVAAGNEGLGEGGEENWFQKLFATAIGISLPTHSQLQVSLHRAFIRLSDRPSTHAPTHSNT